MNRATASPASPALSVPQTVVAGQPATAWVRMEDPTLAAKLTVFISGPYLRQEETKPEPWPRPNGNPAGSQLCVRFTIRKADEVPALIRVVLKTGLAVNGDLEEWSAEKIITVQAIAGPGEGRPESVVVADFARNAGLDSLSGCDSLSKALEKAGERSNWNGKVSFRSRTHSSTPVPSKSIVPGPVPPVAYGPGSSIRSTRLEPTAEPLESPGQTLPGPQETSGNTTSASRPPSSPPQRPPKAPPPRRSHYSQSGPPQVKEPRKPNRHWLIIGSTGLALCIMIILLIIFSQRSDSTGDAKPSTPSSVPVKQNTDFRPPGKAVRPSPSLPEKEQRAVPLVGKEAPAKGSPAASPAAVVSSPSAESSGISSSPSKSEKPPSSSSLGVLLRETLRPNLENLGPEKPSSTGTPKSTPIPQVPKPPSADPIPELVPEKAVTTFPRSDAIRTHVPVPAIPDTPEENRKRAEALIRRFYEIASSSGGLGDQMDCMMWPLDYYDSKYGVEREGVEASFKEIRGKFLFRNYTVEKISAMEPVASSAAGEKAWDVKCRIHYVFKDAQNSIYDDKTWNRLRIVRKGQDFYIRGLKDQN